MHKNDLLSCALKTRVKFSCRFVLGKTLRLKKILSVEKILHIE